MQTFAVQSRDSLPMWYRTNSLLIGAFSVSQWIDDKLKILAE